MNAVFFVCMVYTVLAIGNGDLKKGYPVFSFFSCHLYLVHNVIRDGVVVQLVNVVLFRVRTQNIYIYAIRDARNAISVY